jgi:hypothetical protein
VIEISIDEAGSSLKEDEDEENWQAFPPISTVNIGYHLRTPSTEISSDVEGKRICSARVVSANTDFTNFNQFDVDLNKKSDQSSSQDSKDDIKECFLILARILSAKIG